MRWALRPGLYLLLLPALAVVLLASEPGLRLVLDLALRAVPGELRYEQVRGRLAGPLVIGGLSYRLNDLSFTARRLDLDWRPTSLLAERLHIEHLHLDEPVLHLPAPAPDTPPVAVPQLPFVLAIADLRLRAARLVMGEDAPIVIPALRLSGRADAGHGRLHLDWQGLQWPLADAGVVASPSGKLDLEGGLSRYQWRIQTGVEVTAQPAFDLDGSGTGNADGIAFDALRIHTLGGTLLASGHLHASPEPRWEVALKADGLDPGRHWPDWRGALTAQLATHGHITDAGVEFEARIAALRGQLRGQPLTGAGTVHLSGADWFFDQLRMSLGDATLNLNGRYGERADLQARLRVADLGRVLPQAAGRLSVEARLTGARASPRLAFKLATDRLRYADLGLDHADAEAELGLDTQQPFRLAARARGFHLGERRFDTLSAAVQGKGPDHELHVRGNGPGHALNLRARGAYVAQPALWRGRLLDADWTLPETGAWSLVAPTGVTLAQSQLKLGDACWTQQAARLCLTAQAHGEHGGRQEVKLRVRDFPLARLEQRLDGTAALSAELQRDARGLRGTARLDLGAGTLRWSDAENQSLPFGPGRATARLDGAGLTGVGQLDLPGQSPLTFELQLPGYRPEQGGAARLRAQISADIHDLSPLEPFVADLQQPRGALRARVEIAGTPAQPQWSGSVTLTDGAAGYERAGIQLTGIEAELHAGDAGALSFAARARSGGGALRAHGSLMQQDSGWQGHVSLTGNDFLAMSQRLVEVTLSPALDIVLADNTAHVTGEVLIPKARLAHENTTGAVLPSRDAVITDREKSARGIQVMSDVTVRLGKAVRVASQGLSGRIEGSLQVSDRPGRVSTGRGELTLREGIYKAYGQDLAIEQGRVIYHDTPLDEPELDLRAVRRNHDVRVGLRVRGPLQAPQAELFSEPALPQSDALSQLLTGRPMNEASGDQGRSLMLAANALGLSGGNLLASRIAQSFGLDAFEFTGVEASSTGVTIGKYLTPRLYLSYGTSLLDAAEGLFRLRYQFNRRWTLQTESGKSGTGGDLFFTHER
jgi:translocation and assembly module TamB